MVHKLRHRRWRHNEGKRMGLQEVGWIQKWDTGETERQVNNRDGWRHPVWTPHGGAEKTVC